MYPATPTTQHMPPGPPPLSQALTNAIHVANTRAEEGQRIFGPIAALWDDYSQSDSVCKLPTKLRKPLLALCQEMSRTATRHFDAYIKGTKPSQPLLTIETVCGFNFCLAFDYIAMLIPLDLRGKLK